MTHGTPRLDDQAFGLAIPEPEPADYSDELTNADVDALRSIWTQDERAMGAIVHEFRW